MERLHYIDQLYVAQLAEQQYNAGKIEDLDLIEFQRRDRVELHDTQTSIIANGPIKRYDDVRVHDNIDGRVVGPSRTENIFLVHAPDVVAEMGPIFEATWSDITDRAPINEGEEPMPQESQESLAILQMEVFKRINDRTTSIIGSGFTYDGLIYPCDIEDETRYISMFVMADTLIYPVEINTLNDREAGLFQDPEHLRSFCNAGLDHIRVAYDSGTAQKDIIRQATDAQTILSYVDPRELPPPVPYNYRDVE